MDTGDDVLGMALLGNLLAKSGQLSDDVQKKRAGLLPKFETEEDALRYARRLSALRPGDRIGIINDDDTGFMPAVFVGLHKQEVTFLVYDKEEKRLLAGRTNLTAIQLD